MRMVLATLAPETGVAEAEAVAEVEVAFEVPETTGNIEDETVEDIEDEAVGDSEDDTLEDCEDETLEDIDIEEVETEVLVALRDDGEEIVVLAAVEVVAEAAALEKLGTPESVKGLEVEVLVAFFLSSKIMPPEVEVADVVVELSSVDTGVHA